MPALLCVWKECSVIWLGIRTSTTFFFSRSCKNFARFLLGGRICLHWRFELYRCSMSLAHPNSYLATLLLAEEDNLGSSRGLAPMTMPRAWCGWACWVPECSLRGSTLHSSLSRAPKRPKRRWSQPHCEVVMSIVVSKHSTNPRWSCMVRAGVFPSALIGCTTILAWSRSSPR
jgi:hypothetical protein